MSNFLFNAFKLVLKLALLALSYITLPALCFSLAMPAPDILPIEELPVASITLLEVKRHKDKIFLTFAFSFAIFFLKVPHQN